MLEMSSEEAILYTWWGFAGCGVYVFFIYGAAIVVWRLCAVPAGTIEVVVFILGGQGLMAARRRPGVIMFSTTFSRGGPGSTAWVYRRCLLGPSYSVSLLPGWEVSPLPKAPTWGPSGWGAWGFSRWLYLYRRLRGPNGSSRPRPADPGQGALCV